MAISRNDCLLLLANLDVQDQKIINQMTNRLYQSEYPDIDVIRFINANRQLDLTAFYQKLRKSYNNKKSKLYINIVKEIEEPTEAIITLSALLTQILLFAKNVQNRQMFLKHARSNEICMVLQNYFKTYDITNALKLLRIIKQDLKILENIEKS